MRKLIYIVLCLMLVGCANEKVNESTTAITKFVGDKYITEDGMVIDPLDTTVKFVSYHEKYADTAFEKLRVDIEIYHKLADSSNVYVDENGERINNIKVINDSYGMGEVVTVDPIVIDIINEAKQLMRLSNGYFNMTLGSVIDLYDGKFKNVDSFNTDPENEAMVKALSCTLHVDELDEIIEVNEADSTVTLHEKKGCQGKVEIQLGAFSKGYIASKLDEALQSMDISYMIDLGSSSILTHAGAKDTKQSWNIGIRSVFPNVDYEYIVSMDGDYNLSTSGDDQKYYFVEMDDGTVLRRHHILNPTTGFSESYYRGVSVIAENINGGVLDVLSTALYNISSSEERRNVVRAFEEAYGAEIGYGLIEALNDTEFRLIVNDTMKEHMSMQYVADNVKEIVVEE